MRISVRQSEAAQDLKGENLLIVVRLVSIFPRLDKTGEVRSMLEARAKTTRGQSLSRNIIGEIPTFVSARLFNSLEDLEKDGTDPANAEHRAAISGLSRQPVTVRLLNPIVSAAQSVDSGQRYTQQAVLFPTNDGQDSLRGILEEFAKGQQENGRPRFRMTQLLFPHDGPAFTLGDSYESITELENVTGQRAGAVSALRAKTAPHLLRPSIQRIREILVTAEG